jgi:hypothetical protein
MNGRNSIRALAALSALMATVLLGVMAPALALGSPNTSMPTSTVKYVFVHHSTGDAWLQDGYGKLASTLGTNRYFVSDSNYGWGPDGIGDHTDIGDWWTWFRGTSSTTYSNALFANTGINSSYVRSLADPGGQNTVIMFKSCFPNSGVGGSPSDAIPSIGSNPLAGNGMNELTVGNAKGVYLDLLEDFKTHPDKMFVIVVSPPLKSDATNWSQAHNARALADWLVSPTGLLNGYTEKNVFVFDYFTVLTGGHHRVVGGQVEHSPGASNYLAYPTGDSHPSAAGDRIATAEFVPLLNASYNSWKAGTGAMITPTLTRYVAKLSAPIAGRTKLSRKRSYLWHGTISPRQGPASSVRLEFQRKVAGKYRRYASVSVPLKASATSWSIRVRIRKAGSFRAYVRHADSDHNSGTSAYRAFKVR